VSAQNPSRFFREYRGIPIAIQPLSAHHLIVRLSAQSAIAPFLQAKRAYTVVQGDCRQG